MNKALDYSSTLNELIVMFPGLDVELIEEILASCEYRLEVSIELLLKLSSETYGKNDDISNKKEQKEEKMISMFGNTGKSEQKKIEEDISKFGKKDNTKNDSNSSNNKKKENKYDIKSYNDQVKEQYNNTTNKVNTDSVDNTNTKAKKKSFGDKMKSKYISIIIN